MYNDLDEGIDYAYIFAAGCLDDCKKCTLCRTGKQQLIDVLSGSERPPESECSLLVNCATDCVKQSNINFTETNYCMRHQCAYHCFDGSCPKCSAFIMRLFTQICVNDLKSSFRPETKGRSSHDFLLQIHEFYHEITQKDDNSLQNLRHFIELADKSLPFFVANKLR